MSGRWRFQFRSLPATAEAALKPPVGRRLEPAFFLFATIFRPASAYFFHVRERIKVFTRESAHPRDDVITLWERMGEVSALAQQTAGDLDRTQVTLADTIEHTRNLLGADLSRL
jgi:hypothetical protein